jgi:hypothetical protein
MRNLVWIVVLLAVWLLGGCQGANRTADDGPPPGDRATVWHQADLGAAKLRDELAQVPFHVSNWCYVVAQSDAVTYCLMYPLCAACWICSGLR